MYAGTPARVLNPFPCVNESALPGASRAVDVEVRVTPEAHHPPGRPNSCGEVLGVSVCVLHTAFLPGHTDRAFNSVG